MEANHAFTAVDLDAVLDEFEFHEGEAERMSSSVKSSNSEGLKKESSVIFSPHPEEEENDEDRVTVGEDYWKKAESTEHLADKDDSHPNPLLYDGKPSSTEEDIDQELTTTPSHTSIIHQEEPSSNQNTNGNVPEGLPATGDALIKDDNDADSSVSSSSSSTSCSSSSSSSSSESSSSESILHEQLSHSATSEAQQEQEGGARPKMMEDNPPVTEPSSNDDPDVVPLDSPPPYSEIDPMKKDSGEEELRKLNRPTSLALPPPPVNNTGRQDERGEDLAPASHSESPLDHPSGVVGPPGSTPAIPNVSLVPDLLQGLSEEQLLLGKVPPWWVRDADALNCMICDIKFTLMKRRHHCRACGKVLCNHCCSDRFFLPYMESKEARVCKPCKGILERLKRAEEMNNNNNNSNNANNEDHPEVASRRPNPSNPMEYCSTVPPHQQVAASGGAAANPPSVMVPVGVLKRWEGVSSPDRHVPADPKQVMFSDGIRPGGDLADLDGSPEHRTLSQRSRSSHKSSSSRRSGQSDIARSMLPLEGMPYVAGVGPTNPIDLEEYFRKGQTTAFLINRNLKVHVSLRFYTPANGLIWNYRTEGMNTVGNDEIVFLLTQKDSEELLPPRDIFDHIQKLFEEIRSGTSVHEMGHSVVLSGADFLGGSDYGGFLFIRHSFQCIQSLDLPDHPFVFALLITKSEVPWARVFPLRLVLRLGAEFRYYPCPLWSHRNRGPVYKESGNTIMKILSDFRNFTYSLPIIKGFVVHVEDKLTTVLLPKNRYKLIQKALQNSNDPVLALGANFSPVADSHYVAVQRDEADALKNPTSGSDYETQTINRFNRSRKVTGASFIVFNGALKSTSGLTAKSSIVEDGIMVQISQDKMMEIRKKLHAKEDTDIGCGPIGSPAPDEIVSIRWVEEDRTINAGIKSPIDSLPMDGIASVRIHSGPDFRGDGGHIIRCTEIFLFPFEGEQVSESSESKEMAEFLSKFVCQALTPHLKSLRNKNDIGVLGVRITLEPDNVGYDAGSKGQALSSEFMNSLDNELIPIIHSQSIARRTKFEMIFHILNT